MGVQKDLGAGKILDAIRDSRYSLSNLLTQETSVET